MIIVISISKNRLMFQFFPWYALTVNSWFDIKNSFGLKFPFFDFS